MPYCVITPWVVIVNAIELMVTQGKVDAFTLCQYMHLPFGLVQHRRSAVDGPPVLEKIRAHYVVEMMQLLPLQCTEVKSMLNLYVTHADFDVIITNLL